jgi:putative mRNA 3-end processing factor
MRRFARHSTGFASGWMKLRGNRRRRGFDRGFVVSDHADWPSLLRTVEQSGARQVLATHGNAHSFVRFLAERGVEASELQSQFGGSET